MMVALLWFWKLGQSGNPFEKPPTETIKGICTYIICHGLVMGQNEKLEMSQNNNVNLCDF